MRFQDNGKSFLMLAVGVEALRDQVI